MKIFVINLSSSPERWAHMKRQLSGKNLDYERFPAIVGKKSPPRILTQASCRLWQWCRLGKYLTPSEIGCTLSHLAIYRKMVLEKIPCACILEDDVTIKNNLEDSLKKVEALVSHSQEGIFLLSSVYDNDSEIEKIIPVSGESAAVGYIVSLQAAARLLTLNMPIKSPCDDWRLWRSLGVPLYKSIPRAVIHDNRNIFGSMMDEENVYHIKNFYIWKIKRIFGVSLCKILCFFHSPKKLSKSAALSSALKTEKAFHDIWSNSNL